MSVASAVGVGCDVTSKKRWAMGRGSFAAKIALKIKEERRKVLPTNQSGFQKVFFKGKASEKLGRKGHA